MTDSIYRFRSLKRLLEDGELERQEIYFASRAELNDPVEGYLDLFWQGDEVLWENLFRHYLAVLEHAVNVIQMFGDTAPALSAQNLGIFTMPSLLNPLPYPGSPPTEAHKARFARMADRFVKGANVSAMIRHFSSHNAEIRRDQLIFYLKMLHPEAVATVRAGDAPQHAATNSQVWIDIPKLLKAEAKLAKSRTQAGQSVADIIYHGLRRHIWEEELKKAHEDPAERPGTNGHFLIRLFPEAYVEALERLMYPPWYVACFLENINNAAVWGHYGDGHKGACLQFKTHSHPESNTRCLKLRKIIGYSMVRGQDTSQIRDFQLCGLQSIDYQRKYPTINYFHSMLRLPVPQLYDNWFTAPDGRKSPSLHAVVNDPVWHHQYWALNTHRLTTKLKEWEYEGEQRLILQSSLSDLEAAADRRLTYDFKDLEAVIFGLNTPELQKLEVIRVLQRKCDEQKTYGVKFYQAYYDHASGKIAIDGFPTPAAPTVPASSP